MTNFVVSKPFRVTARLVLASLLAFFFVVIAMSGLMAYIAIDTFDGKVEENAYRGGLKFNEKISAARAVKALGWRADIALGAHSITVNLADRNGLALRETTLTGMLWRQTAQGNDKAIRFDYLGAGKWRGQLPGDAHGRWELRLLVRQDDKTASFRRDLVIKQKAFE